MEERQDGSNAFTQQNNSVLNNFDFTAIEELDPSLRKSQLSTDNNLEEGHIVLYDREAPFELRIQDAKQGPQEVGSLEAIRVKILLLVSENL
jgi:hypothetical protein